MTISLVGMTGAGKTTVGTALAERLCADFIDLDSEIEKKTGRPIPEIFELFGEEAFRQAETAQLEAVLKNREKALVLSCGGGIATREKNRELLKKHSFVVWLVRPLGEILKNPEILARPPILGDAQKYIRLSGEREPQYA
ncbi:MAG: shikimate kinase, partial [Oscillospiraceae bacterium]|nr:shikimate kinase [Oscillospiraceae bacterium]